MKVVMMEHENNKECPGAEIRGYRLSKLEKTNEKYHKEVLHELSEIRKDTRNLREDTQKEYNKLQRNIIQQDIRIDYLEKKFSTQEKYLYGILITIISQVLLDILRLLR